MRRLLLLLVVVGTFMLVPAASAAPPVLENGTFAGSIAPAPPFTPASPITSFKVEVLG